MRLVSTVLLVVLLAAAVWWSFAGRAAVAIPVAGAGGDRVAHGASVPAGGVEADVFVESDIFVEPGTVDAGRELASDRAVGRLMQAGEAIVGAEVVCCTGQLWQPTVVARTRTAADGRFELPSPGQAFWLAVSHERLPAGWHTKPSPPNTRDFGDVEAPVPGVIVGRVRDTDGNAVLGAKVVCEISPYAFAQPDGDGERPTVLTDGEGAFRLTRIAPGEHPMRCESAAYAILRDHRVEVPAGGEVATEFELHRGAQLNGVVLDWRGQPLDGAEVRCESGRHTVSDALGRFAFPHFRRGDDLWITAAGHMHGEVGFVYDVADVVIVRLERAVKLRGVVHGTGGKPGLLRIEPRDSARPGASNRLPYGLVFEDLDVVRDGRFEIDGLSCSAFELTVTVPGVGKVGPVFVEVDDDTEIEMTLVPMQRVAIVLRDEQGRPIDRAQLVVDPGAQNCPSLYEPGETLSRRILRNGRLPRVDMAGGLHTLALPPGEAPAFAVLAEGFLPAAHSFVAGQMPDRVEVTMLRAGSVHGVVVGGDRSAHGAQFRFWPVGVQVSGGEDDWFLGADGPPAWPRGAQVQKDDTFQVERVPPGDYRAVLYRSNRRCAAENSAGVALVDGGADTRIEVAFSVVAGQQTEVEIADAPQGVLRGRVLVRGVPTAGIPIMASRPRRPGPRKRQIWPIDPDDWDEEVNWKRAAGQLSRADGGFELHYCVAGPVELRVRHPDGHATSSPMLVDLPPPGGEVVRDVYVPVGEIRGRFPIDAVPKKARNSYRMTLFPLVKAGGDPFHAIGDWSSPLSWSCAHQEGGVDGAFAFSYLSPGIWIVRVHTDALDDRLLWQGAVEVQDGLVDLGVIDPRRAMVELAWQWQNGTAPEEGVHGMWLRRLIGDPARPVWATTLPGEAPRTDVLEPGRYSVQPFGYYEWSGLGMNRGISGPPLAAPVTIEVAADGTVKPAVMTFVPLPSEPVPPEPPEEGK